MSALTVYSVLWGDKYTPGYVYTLKEMVEKNLTVPHEFVCITDHDLPGIKTQAQVVDWPGWWQKLSLFSIANGPSLYFDLDVVITGNLDYLVPYTESRFSAPANWAQSGHGGIQSSVMAWDGRLRAPFEKFDYEKDSKRLYGDQEFLWELLVDDWQKIPHVGSYKYHCRSELPDWMRVCVFHGLPDPHEVKDEWILPYTRILHSNIRLDMLSAKSA